MPRIPRVIYINVPHHITQRGIRKLDIFLDDTDRLFFLELMLKFSRKHKLKIYAYCLMSNHFHLIAAPSDEMSLSLAMRDTCARYAEYFNRKNGYSGHLFQDRYFSAPLDKEHFFLAARYVEQNPVRAGIATESIKYRWSSAKGNCGAAKDILLFERSPISRDSENWRSILKMSLDDDSIERIRMGNSRGRPIGSVNFVRRLETKLGRQLRVRPVGRPKRSSLIKKRKSTQK